MRTTDHPIQTEAVAPGRLEELFPVFERLEAGAALALMPASGARPTMVSNPDAAGGWLGVTSSGSTGRPKMVWCRWRELRDSVTIRPEHQSWWWASPYSPCTFAGVQVALHAWLSSRQVLDVDGTWDRAWGMLRTVDALSATPTYVDLLLQNEPAGADRWQPQQVTLGGEPLRPALGARLKARFPTTHFTAVYAAAELGVLARSHDLDGWYEVHSLERHCEAWRVAGQVLEVLRGDLWRSTGDVIELQGERFRVIGRADSVANVGGTKVSLAEVAELAEQVPGVRRAVAVAESNPITGEVVALRYALDPMVERETTERVLQGHLRSVLRKEAWPRRWVRDEVGLAANAKRTVR